MDEEEEAYEKGEAVEVQPPSLITKFHRVLLCAIGWLCASRGAALAATYGIASLCRSHR